MTNAEYRKKRLERKNRHRADRNILFYGMGVRVLNSAPDTIRHKRVRSAKKNNSFFFIIFPLSFFY